MSDTNNQPSDKLITDEQLVKFAKNSDEKSIALLIKRYMPLIKNRAGRYKNQTFAMEDLIQEGMLEFLMCLYRFDESIGVPFSCYANRCVTNKLISTSKSAMTNKNKPLNDYLSFEEYDSLNISPHQDQVNQDPSSIVIKQEEVEFMEQQVKIHLSYFEQEILNLYLSSHSYEEMANILKTTTKTIDNVLQKIRRKLRANS